MDEVAEVAVLATTGVPGIAGGGFMETARPNELYGSQFGFLAVYANNFLVGVDHVFSADLLRIDKKWYKHYCLPWLKVFGIRRSARRPILKLELTDQGEVIEVAVVAFCRAYGADNAVDGRGVPSMLRIEDEP